MKAVTVTKAGGPEVLKLAELPEPQVKEGEVKIKVIGFGINRAEIYFRSGNFGDIASDRVPGIEAVGELVADPSGSIELGQKVIVVMGGMMLSRNGSYAEYVTVPRSNVLAIQSDIDFITLASLPESYLTVWGALDLNLQIQAGETLLVRGATSAVGLAAVAYAKARQLTVIATTRDQSRQDRLKKIGADYVLIDDKNISDQVRELCPEGVDKVLEVIGAATLKDSLKATKNWGEVVVIGLLGGPPILEQFNLMNDLSNTVKLSFFGSGLLGSKHLPLSDSPLNWIAEQVHLGIMPDITANVFSFDDIQNAHISMEKNQSFGKQVVQV